MSLSYPNPSQRTSMRAVWTLVSVISAVLMLLSSVLIALRIEQLMLDLAQSRSLRMANQLRGEIEAGFNLGLGIADQSKLIKSLQANVDRESTLTAAMILNHRQESVVRFGEVEQTELINPTWTRQLLGLHGPLLPSVSRTQGSQSFIGFGAVDGSGRVAAVTWLVFNQSALRQTGWRTLLDLLPAAGLGTLIVALVLGLTVTSWARQTQARLLQAQQHPSATPANGSGVRSKQWLVATAALLVTLLVLVGLVGCARSIARPHLVKQVDLSAASVAASGAARVERALRIGVPAERLVGIEDAFRLDLASAPEAAFMQLQHANNNVLAQVRAGPAESDGPNRVAKVTVADAPDYWVSVGVPEAFVDRSIASILFDLLFALVVAMVLIRELLSSVWERSPLKPLLAFEWAPANAGLQAWQKAIDSSEQSAKLVTIRLVVFLTAIGEELLRPFFAVFAAEVVPISDSLSPTMLAGLPVAVFMLTLAFAQPMGPWVLKRFEVRLVFGTVSCAAAVLLVATALATHGGILIALRAGSGLAYGLLLIVAQSAIVRITSSSQRASGLVAVSGAIVAAGVCGPVLGGLMVERLGMEATFTLAALCMIGAAVVVLPMQSIMPERRKRARTRTESPDTGSYAFLAVLREYRVMAVTWFAAVPARLAAAAVLVVVTPLYLLELHEPTTISGRVLMLYFLAFMITAPLVARWSDASGTRKPWILAGCLLSAASCALVPLLGGVLGVALCCFLLGVAQAILSSPQLALITEAFERTDDQYPHNTTPAQALAAFRLIERIGSIAAPFIVAVAVSWFGLAGAVGAIGVLLGLGALGVFVGLLGYREGVVEPAKPSVS